MTRLWAILLLASAGNAWAKPPAVGDACILKKPMKLRAKPGGKVLETAKAGSKLEVLEVLGGWLVLEGGRTAGYASAKDYARLCRTGVKKPKEAKEAKETSPATTRSVKEEPLPEPPALADDTPLGDEPTEPTPAAARPLVEEVPPPAPRLGPREFDPTDISSPLTLIMGPESSPRERRSGAATWRTVGYVGVGIGAASLAGGAAAFFIGRGKAEALRDDIAAYSARSVRTEDEAEALTGRRATIGRLDSLAVIGLGVGVAALGAGIVLWVANSDSSRGRSRAGATATPPLRLVLVPLGNGVGLSGAF